MTIPMKLVAQREAVARLQAALVASADSTDGWTKTFIDPVTGERWCRTYLGSEYHGGGMPILVREPMPGVDDLLEIAAHSVDETEIAASAWLLTDLDREGGFKERLVAIAEQAVSRGDQIRAALLVGWGGLDSEMNLRPALGRVAAEVTRDHEHFKAIAARARHAIHSRTVRAPLRDPSIFESI